MENAPKDWFSGFEEIRIYPSLQHRPLRTFSMAEPGNQINERRGNPCKGAFHREYER